MSSFAPMGDRKRVHPGHEIGISGADDGIGIKRIGEAR